MLTQEQGFTKIDGIVAYDLVIIIQMIDKLLKNGLVTGPELPYVAALRQKSALAIKTTAGIDIDNPSAPPSACNVPLRREETEV
jgi:hypothetical protein